MKQIYGWMTATETDLEVELNGLRNRLTALELELADLRAQLRTELALPPSRVDTGRLAGH